jgi:protein gp37
MGEKTKIAWCHATFNPWRGCSRVSSGCQRCYAETMAKRNPSVFGTWGRDGERVVASESMWREPLKWNRKAEAAGIRKRVFCGSMMDVFEDRQDLLAPRNRLFELIGRTPWLDWLLLTKRANSARDWLIASSRPFVSGGDWRFGGPFPLKNIWLGATVENQAMADHRLPRLLDSPARLRFVSCEPLLDWVDLTCLIVPYGEEYDYDHGFLRWDALTGFRANKGGGYTDSNKISWVIIGCESGPKRRLCKIEWVRSLLKQCRTAGIPVFVKQLDLDGQVVHDMEQFPADLQVREFPDA